MYDVFYPNNKTLAKAIESYAFLNALNSSVSYYAFPQKGVTIAFLSGAKVKYNANEIIISSGNKDNLVMICLGKYLTPLKVTYENSVQELSINFTAIGVNYFFKNYFSLFSAEPVHVEEIPPTTLSPYAIFSTKRKVAHEALENYLLQKFQSKQLKSVETAIELINTDPTLLTHAVAKKVFVSQKSLQRLFRKHVGCTSSQYKKIVKFRNSVGYYFSGKTKNLTELGLQSDYCDSPEFYHQINKVTGWKPKEFFKLVSDVGEGNFPYVIQ